MKNLAIWLVENLKKEYIQSHRNWLGRWIPNPGVPGSKSLGDSKVNSAFYPSEVDQMGTRTYWGLSGKKKTVSL